MLTQNNGTEGEISDEMHRGWRYGAGSAAPGDDSRAQAEAGKPRPCGREPDGGAHAAGLLRAHARGGRSEGGDERLRRFHDTGGDGRLCAGGRGVVLRGGGDHHTVRPVAGQGQEMTGHQRRRGSRTGQ